MMRQAYLLGRLPEDVSWLDVSRVACLEGAARAWAYGTLRLERSGQTW
jgi:hypothetical protein